MDQKRQSRPTPMSGPPAEAGTGTDVWESWHRASHLVFYGMLALAALLALPDPSLPWAGRAAAVGLVMLLGGWYRFAVMSRPGWIQERPLTGLGYFAVAGILFLGLIFLHPAFMLLAFNLYWQVFSFWPTRWASPGAVVLTAAMWWRSAASDGGPLPPGGAAVFFFLITVVVATVLSLFIGAIIGQSEERKRLIGELEATRRDLAAEERRAGVLEERGRLAREIHDTLAQGFVGIVTQLEAAEADLPFGMEATRRRLDSARRIARDNLTEARRLVAALRPEILEGASLPEALRRVAARWSEGNAPPGGAGGAGERGQARPGEPCRDHPLLHGGSGVAGRAGRRTGFRSRSRPNAPRGWFRDRGDARTSGKHGWPPAHRERTRSGNNAHDPAAAGSRTAPNAPAGGQMTRKIRVLVADDHPVVRAGMQGLLSREGDIAVVGEAADGQEAVELATLLAPDVVLMDLRMPRMDGVSAIAQIRGRRPETRVLVLTTYDTDADILRAVEAGATGYLLKDAPREQLYEAVRATASGRSSLAPAVAERLMRRAREPRREGLSSREIEVLELVRLGRSNREIARDLHVSEATVKTHLVHAFGKLGVSDRTAAVNAALERGIIRMGD